MNQTKIESIYPRGKLGSKGWVVRIAFSDLNDLASFFASNPAIRTDIEVEYPLETSKQTAF